MMTLFFIDFLMRVKVKYQFIAMLVILAIVTLTPLAIKVVTPQARVCQVTLNLRILVKGCHNSLQYKYLQFLFLSIIWTFCPALLKAGQNVLIFFLARQLLMLTDRENKGMLVTWFLFSALTGHSVLL